MSEHSEATGDRESDYDVDPDSASWETIILHNLVKLKKFLNASLPPEYRRTTQRALKVHKHKKHHHQHGQGKIKTSERKKIATIVNQALDCGVYHGVLIKHGKFYCFKDTESDDTDVEPNECNLQPKKEPSSASTAYNRTLEPFIKSPKTSKTTITISDDSVRVPQVRIQAPAEKRKSSAKPKAFRRKRARK